MRLILDLVLPRRCAGCGTPDASWCADCTRSLGRPFAVERPGLPPAYALGAYQGAARRAVLAYKERGRRELAGALGRALALALPRVRAGPFVLVPAPSRPSAARARGGQHMLAVGRACAAQLVADGMVAEVVAALRLDGRARDSVGLSASARAANLLGRLRLDPRCSPAPGTAVVLLDDVITTGATAAACTSVLAESGIPVTAVLAFTATR